MGRGGWCGGIGEPDRQAGGQGGTEPDRHTQRQTETRRFPDINRDRERQK